MRGEQFDKDGKLIDKNKQAEDQKARDAHRELDRQRQEKASEGKTPPARSYPGITQGPDSIAQAPETYRADELNVVYPEPSITADNITTGLTERERQNLPNKPKKEKS